MTDEATPIFRPYCRFSRKADTLDVYVSDERKATEVINDQLWLYRGLDTGEVAGCRIMGAAALVDGLRAMHGEAMADDVLYPWVSRLAGPAMSAMVDLWWLCSDFPMVIADEECG